MDSLVDLTALGLHLSDMVVVVGVEVVAVVVVAVVVGVGSDSTRGGSRGSGVDMDGTTNGRTATTQVVVPVKRCRGSVLGEESFAHALSGRMRVAGEKERGHLCSSYKAMPKLRRAVRSG
jgi:hypothetical protein